MTNIEQDANTETFEVAVKDEAAWLLAEIEAQTYEADAKSLTAAFMAGFTYARRLDRGDRDD